MKTIPALACVAALTLIGVGPARADPPQSATAPAAKFTLDTPIEALVADPRSRVVLDNDLPNLLKNPRYDEFKGMSLTALSGFAPDKLTPERLDKVKTDLARIE